MHVEGLFIDFVQDCEFKTVINLSLAVFYNVTQLGRNFIHFEDTSKISILFYIFEPCVNLCFRSLRHSMGKCI